MNAEGPGLLVNIDVESLEQATAFYCAARPARRPAVHRRLGRAPRRDGADLSPAEGKRQRGIAGLESESRLPPALDAGASRFRHLKSMPGAASR